MLTFAIKKKRTPSIAPKRHTPAVSPMSHSLHLQQAKVRHILRSPTLQPKLTIGKPNDKYEQEADRVADEVMRMPEPRLQRQAEEEELIQTKPLAEQITPLVQRQMEEEEEEPIQAKSAGDIQLQRQEAEPEEEEETLQAKPLTEQIAPLVQRQVEPEDEEEEPIQARLADDLQVQRQEEEPEEELIQTKQVSTHTPAVTPSLASRIQSLKGGGQPLPSTVRNYMEPRFGHDFSNVRIHTGQASSNTAKQLNAKAFTTGKNIFFGEQQYSPHTTSGKSLLAHELSHVMQQNNRGGSIDNKNVIQRYSASSAVSYALKHALTSNTKSYMYYSSDCTNFISQALYAGGWTMKTGRGYCKDLRSNDVWWYRKNGCIEGKICIPWRRFNCAFERKRHNSHTWSVADHFYYFVKKSGRATAIKYFKQLRYGDVLQRSKPFSTDINHTMIVTKKASKNFYLSYHTNNRKNKPFYTEGSTKGFYAICPPPRYKYYGWNIT